MSWQGPLKKSYNRDGGQSGEDRQGTRQNVIRDMEEMKKRDDTVN